MRLLRSTPTESVLKSPASLLPNMKLKTIFTTARLYVDVPYLHNRKELTLCFERSKWRTWLASLAAAISSAIASNEPKQSHRTMAKVRGRPARDQDKVREYIPEKYPKRVNAWPYRSAQGDESGRQARFHIHSGARYGAPARCLSRV